MHRRCSFFQKPEDILLPKLSCIYHKFSNVFRNPFHGGGTFA